MCKCIKTLIDYITDDDDDDDVDGLCTHLFTLCVWFLFDVVPIFCVCYVCVCVYKGYEVEDYTL